MEQVLAVVLGIALLALVAFYERALTRIARFLRRGDRGANERVTLGFSTPGVSSVAAAVNEEMDALRDERAAMREQQESFRRDLAALSHDIRTPLAGAQGYLQLYERIFDPDEKARCLREATARLAAMRELTDALFAYAKAADEKSPVELASIEVLPVLASAVAGMYPRFVERGWEPAIRFADEDARAMAEEDSLRRVFDNLLVNALRYGASAPSVSQSVLPSAGGGADMLAVTFSNEVEDASAIDAERLFERFYRADGARAGGGAGLGLSIVAGLCARMGGSVAANVEDGRLAITVSLPRAVA